LPANNKQEGNIQAAITLKTKNNIKTRNQLKNTLKKEARNNWRWFINKHTFNLSLPYNKGL